LGATASSPPNSRTHLAGAIGGRLINKRGSGLALDTILSIVGAVLVLLRYRTLSNR